MSILTDKELKEYGDSIITPFIPEKISSKTISGDMVKVPSFGLSHTGYDVVLQPVWKSYKLSSKTKHSHLAREEIKFTGNGMLGNVIYPDPISILDDTEEYFNEISGETYLLKSNSFVLGVTEEYFSLPLNMVGSLFCKSTLARMGLILPPTIAEPGWRGHLVVEIYNASPRDIILYSGVGIGQMIFWHTSGSETPYNGKYQDQKGVQCAVQ